MKSCIEVYSAIGQQRLLAREQGFSLTELLIAMTLGLILTSGMFVVFSGNQRSAALNTEMSNMQESMRFALNAMSEDIRMAGYQGCADLNSGTVEIIANNPPSADLRSTVISGAVIRDDQSWDPAPQLGTGSGAFQPPDDITPRAGTHTIAMQYAKNPGSGLTGEQSSNGVPNSIGPLVLENEIDVQEDGLALVSTCESGEIFRVSQTSVQNDGTMILSHEASHNSRDRFQQIYGMPANIAQTRVMPFTTNVYYIADTGDNRPDGTPLFALYQQTMPFNQDDNPPVMLIEGVENMRVQFGIGAPNGQLRYVTADDNAYDSVQIRSVRIGLLMSSYKSILDAEDTSTYVLSGETVSPSDTDTTAAAYPNDKRLRLAFNTTVSVRNRRAQN
ncbi:MAG: PilW family protein [Granulosicoccus sp.]